MIPPGTAGVAPVREGGAPAVEMIGVRKAFGEVVACDGIDLAVMPGRITALLGENGAGKSTLMNILAGLIRADAGSVQVDGRAIDSAGPTAAASRGVVMVHQQPALVAALRVWENVVLGRAVRLDAEAARRTVREVGARYGLSVDPDAVVDGLSAAERQRVELIRCLAREPRVLILDEPTSVLTAAEARSLFSVLRRSVDAAGRAVVLISHRLGEVLAAADEVVVLRQGRVVATHAADAVDAVTLAAEMAGPARPSAPRAAPPRTWSPGGADRSPALRTQGLVVTAPDGRRLLDGVDLEVADGEILGLAAIVGNGQAALLDLLIDRVRAEAGTIEVRGRSLRPGGPGVMAGAGVAVVTDDPQRTGLVLDMSVAENLFLAGLGDHAVAGVLQRSRIRRRAAELIERYGIRTPSPDAPVRRLSGGNQQRVVLARELSREPAVLVATQMTRGLDAAAVPQVRESLLRAAREGTGVILISSEPEELLGLCDRIAVLHRGRLVADLRRRDATAERLGLLMAGEAA